MSLSTREQQALDGIENGLAGSDPRLAGLLATFARLNSGETMPAREEVPLQGGRARRFLRRAGRLLAAYSGFEGALLGVLIAVGLIALAMAFGSGSGRRTCVPMWPVACVAPASAHLSHVPAPATS